MSEQQLRDLVLRGFSIREIGTALCCSYSNVRYWLRYYGMKTRQSLIDKSGIAYICPCGETDPRKFYGRKRYKCARCHNDYCLVLGRKKRELALEIGGNCCRICGFAKYRSALEFHHLDPSRKDPAFKSMRGWSEDRIRRELETCILLCGNCHAAIHSGELAVPAS